MQVRYFFASALILLGCGGGDGDMDIGDPGGDAGDPPDPSASIYDDPLERLDSLATGIADGLSGIEEIRALSDGRLVYCTTRAGVVVVDASDPLGLSEATRIDTGPCQHLAASGSRLYVAHRGDVNDPESRITTWDLGQSPPVLLDTFTRAGTTFEGLTASGAMVYAAARDRGVAVLEWNGSELAERAMFADGVVNGWGVAVADTTLYVADAAGGLVVVDVSDPTAPVRSGGVSVFGSPNAVVLGDGGDSALAYVSAGYAGISVIDVSDATAPREVGFAEMPGSAQQLDYRDGHLFVAALHDVRVFDVSTPAQPALVATEFFAPQTGTPRVRAVAAREDAVFIGEWSALYSAQLTPDRLAPDLWTRNTSVGFFNVGAGQTDSFALP
ncbi:MAG: hypothetical protein AAGC55_16180, partial [Myxococcota bacterium]